MDNMDSIPIPPFVPKTSGVNWPFSISKTLCKYAGFFSFVFLWISVMFPCSGYLRSLYASHGHKKMHLLPDQKLSSNLASKFEFSDRKSRCSLSSVSRCGSDSTFLHTLASRVVRRSRLPSYLCVTNPLFLQKGRGWCWKPLHVHKDVAVQIMACYIYVLTSI